MYFLFLFYFSFPSLFLLSLPLPLLPLPLPFFFFFSLFLFFSFFSSSPLSPTNTKKVPVQLSLAKIMIGNNLCNLCGHSEWTFRRSLNEFWVSLESSVLGLQVSRLGICYGGFVFENLWLTSNLRYRSGLLNHSVDFTHSWPEM